MASGIPATMKAWQCGSYRRGAHDGLSELVVNSAAPVPRPGERQLLVRVAFAAASPVDLELLAGACRDRFPVRGFPFVPGLDAAGEVAALGAGCSSDLHVGDPVVLCLGLAESCSRGAAFGSAGAFAEYCVCPEAQACKVPPDALLSRLAGLPLAALSAYQALFTGKAQSTKGEALGSVAKGSKVLVLGGDRGTGHLAVQLAHCAGAQVMTTAAPSKLDFLRGLGADRVVDWRERDWTMQLRSEDFDLVYDCVGWVASPEEMGRAVKVMKPGGQFIAVHDFEAFEPEGVIKDCYFKTLVPKVDAEDFKLLVQKSLDQKLEVNIDKIYLFEELPHALAHCASGQTNGKVVISMEPHGEQGGHHSGSAGGA
mmetsp:Transcript_917/g.3222  ORF Transcript_917/g.3222 Transcript_917/m.3222 type:complete len:369 (-) Transcript_917:305-1411(-)